MANDQGTWLVFDNIVLKSTTHLSTTETPVGDRLINNLSTREGDDVWRVEGINGSNTTYRWTARFDVEESFDVCAVHWPRPTYPGVTFEHPSISETDTISFTARDEGGAPVAGGTVAPQATNASPFRSLWWHRLPSVITARSIDFEVSVPSRAAMGFADTGGLMIGTAFDPGIGLIYPAAKGREFNREIRKTPTGKRYGRGYMPNRQWRCAFDALSPDEEAQFENAILRTRGVDQILMVRGDRATGADGMFGYIKSADDMRLRDPELSGFSMTVTEFL